MLRVVCLEMRIYLPKPFLFLVIFSTCLEKDLSTAVYFSPLSLDEGSRTNDHRECFCRKCCHTGMLEGPFLFIVVVSRVALAFSHHGKERRDGSCNGNKHFYLHVVLNRYEVPGTYKNDTLI